MFSGLTVLACVLGLRSAGILQPVELRAHDALLSLLRVGARADPRVTLVTVGEADLARHGWPLPDEVLAEALRRLLAHAPRAVGLDLFRDRPQPQARESLARLLREDERIVGVMKYPGDEGGGVAAPAAIEDPARVGFADMVVDPDGTVRRGLLLLGGGEEARWSLALRLAMAYLAPFGIVPEGDEHDPSLLRLGATTYVPLREQEGGYARLDDRGYQFLLSYPTGAAGIATFSLQQVLDGGLERGAVQDRVVILGTVAESVKDEFLTPLAGEGPMPGAELHAQITSQLVGQALGGARPIRPAPWIADAVWTGLWCLLGGLTALQLHGSFLLLPVAATGIFILFATAAALLAFGLWIALVPPLLGAAATLLLQAGYLARRERTERGMLMRLFATHLSPGIAEALWQARESLLEGKGLRPQSLEATVLFSDVRGYTTVSEAMTPSILLAWLNEYVSAMIDTVARHEGVVLELTGDGVLAVFGIPVARSSAAEIAADARRAVRCALAMGEALTGLNSAFRARDLPPANIRVGIHTGPLVAGSLGSEARRKYTVVGDTVNVAARLESYDRGSLAGEGEALHCRILISGATYACLGGEHGAIAVGRLDLKGRGGPVTVHQILPTGDQARACEGVIR